MVYCWSCTNQPAKKKITQEMAKLFQLDPKSRVCLDCYRHLSDNVRALR